MHVNICLVLPVLLRLALGSGDRQINKSRRLIFLKANYTEQHNLLVLIVQESKKASWQCRGCPCVWYCYATKVTHLGIATVLLHLRLPFCIHCQDLVQIFTLLCSDYCSRLRIHFELPILSPLLSPLFFSLSIWHRYLLNRNLRWCRAQLHSKIYL